MAESYLPKPLSHAHSESLRLTTEKEAEYREAQLVANGYDPGIAREAVAMAFGRVCAKETGRMTGPNESGHPVVACQEPCGTQGFLCRRGLGHDGPHRDIHGREWAPDGLARDERDVVGTLPPLAPDNRAGPWVCVNCGESDHSPRFPMDHECGSRLATGTRERPPLNLPGLHAEERPGTGVVRIETDEGVCELTAEQMDALLNYWRSR